MKKATPYLLLLPALLFTALVVAYPLVQNVLNSLRDVSMIKGTGAWVGLNNYERVLHDPLFLLSFRNTLVYALLGTALVLHIGLGLALLLNEDAALIDGCSRMMALRRIILPLALPGIGATALFAFLGSWNEFFFALILTSSDATKTIPVGIGLFVGEYLDIWNQMAASAVLLSVPPLVLFALTRKTFVKGLMTGGVK
jgi:ABC-type glycerol-3-phosphate transport system permease component